MISLAIYVRVLEETSVNHKRQLNQSDMFSFVFLALRIIFIAIHFILCIT